MTSNAIRRTAKDARAALLRRLPLREAIAAFCPIAVPSLLSLRDILTATATMSDAEMNVERSERPGWPFIACEIDFSTSFDFGFTNIFADNVLRIEARGTVMPRSLVYPLICRKKVRISSVFSGGSALGLSSLLSGFHVPPDFANAVERVRGNAWSRLITTSSTEIRSIVTDHLTEVAGVFITGTIPIITAGAASLTSQLVINIDGKTLFPGLSPRTGGECVFLSGTHERRASGPTASALTTSALTSGFGGANGEHLRMSPMLVDAGRSIDVLPAGLPAYTHTNSISFTGGTLDPLSRAQ